MPLKIASRQSPLAVWQAETVAQHLKDELQIDSSFLYMTTKGDRIQNRFLHEIGGKGVFIRELEQAMIEGKADFAVHSLKDLPAILPKPMVLAACLERQHPGDFLIVSQNSNFGELFGGEGISRSYWEKLLSSSKSSAKPWKVATGSLRRSHLLMEPRHPDSIAEDCAVLGDGALEMMPLRGNVQTRLNKLSECSFDGIVMAQAAVCRMGWTGKTGGVFEFSGNSFRAIPLGLDWFYPSSCQGIMGIEMVDEHASLDTVAQLNHPASGTAAAIERGVLAALGGDCTLPISCFASETSLGRWRVDFVVFAKNHPKIEGSVEFAKNQSRSKGVAMVMTKLQELGLSENWNFHGS